MPIKKWSIHRERWTITAGPDAEKIISQQLAFGTKETPGKYFFVGPEILDENNNPLLEEDEITGPVTNDVGKVIEGETGIWRKYAD
jgi:hypothetical protein